MHIISAHGRSLPADKGFLVEMGVNIITITRLNGSPIITSRGDPIQDEIASFYNTGHYIFQNKDRTTKLTDDGIRLQEMLNSWLSLTDDNRIFFKNHLPWPRQILLNRHLNNSRFIDIIRNYSSSPKYKEGFRLSAYYFPDGVDNLNNYQKVMIESHHSAPPTTTRHMDVDRIKRGIEKMGYLGGSGSQYRGLCTIVDTDNLLIHNVSNDKLVLLAEKSYAIKYNNTNISFKPSSGMANECNIGCISGSTIKCCKQNSSLITELDNIIAIEGPGSYIVIACRGTDHLPPSSSTLLRQRSANN